MRKSGGKFFGASRRRRQVQHFAFFNQRTDPIHLPSFADGIVDNGKNSIASVQTNELGGNGGSARRKFVDHGYINVGEIAHGERARNGRSRKHQKMRTASVRHEASEC